MRNNEQKIHYKMYKSGKKWIISGIITAAIMTGGIGVNVHADTVNGQQSTDQNQDSTEKNQNSSATSTSATSSATSQSATAPSSQDISFRDASKPSTNLVDNQTTNTNSQNPSPYSVYVPSSNSNNTSGSSKNDLNSADTSNSGSSGANNLSSGNPDQSNPSNGQSSGDSNQKSSSAQPTSSSAQPTSNSSSANTAISVNDDFKSAQVASNPTVISTNIKQDSNNNYHFYQGGQIQKNVLINQNGVLAYFDKDGNYQVLSTQLPQTNVQTVNNDYAQQNAIYDTSSNSITNTNGFLTADSWYRPKQILQNGSTWVTSQPNDFRPLMMVWWPNKQVQINYLNYMNANNLGSNNYTNNSTIDQLTQGAQDVQRKIEQRITSSNGNTDWLKTLVSNFVSTQYQWNISSEDPNTDDGLQGGTLAYGNSNLTPYANSRYRLINRAPATQTGVSKYNADTWNGSEYLLANDVDNSNPAVQAEDLNWLYYLLNLGSITKNDSKGNFDSIRIDATDNMDSDLVNLSAQYMKDAYGIKSDKDANAHLSILEDWSKNDAYYLQDHGQTHLTIDDYLHFKFSKALNAPMGARVSMSNLIDGSLVNRAKDSTQNKAIPNYMFVRAHDSGVQDIIFQIIKDKVDPSADSSNFTQDQINKAFVYYNQDMNKAKKKYTYYNIPMSYAFLLTNKDTVPRIYYGDMYTDDGQYMSKKTPYYKAIRAMLMARVKYVAGGQSMKMLDKNLVASVRYGKGAMTAKQKGTKVTRTSGMLTLASNNTKMKKTTAVVNMGAAHKNQYYRPLILTSRNGTVQYSTDRSAKKHYIKTDSKGNLKISSSLIKGYSNAQVSGYLSMWVPVGAKTAQDVRTAPSSKPSTDGNVLHSNNALDSNVIFEGFSNFQSMPTNNNQYMNVILQKQSKLKQLKSWGITSMQLPPQYRSSTGNSFLDATVQNGYAFSDRYDVGYGNPTKYGTADQLNDAITAIHGAGMQAMADFVPNQLYNLTKPEVVSATRVDKFGNYNGTTNIFNDMYYAQTTGGGQYQQQYGGEFLDTLKQKYPDLFTTKQISTGVPIDGSTKIKEWSAKYLNGTNIQGRGSDYILRNAGNDHYFTVGTNGVNLPNQLTGQTVQTGWVNNPDGTVSYYTYSGQKAQNATMTIDGNNYAFDTNGNLITGEYTTPNGIQHVSLPNGQGLTNTFYLDNGKLKYLTQNGNVYSNGFMGNPYNSNQYYYFGKDGVALTGQQVIEGFTYYFDKNGIQQKGVIADNHYYDNDQGHMVTDEDINVNGKNYHADKTGNLKLITAADEAKIVKKAKAKMNSLSQAKTKAKSMADGYKGKKLYPKYAATYRNTKDKYYRAEKYYLNLIGQYNPNFYYDFDNIIGKKFKVTKNVQAYKSKNFTKKNKSSKIKKNAKITVKNVTRSKNSTTIQIDKNKFITGIKNFFKEL